VAAAFLIYPLFGPMIHFDLTDARRPVGLVAIERLLAAGDKTSTPPSEPAHPAEQPPPDPPTPDILERMVDPTESSIAGHIGALVRGLPLVLDHPLGLGLGASTYRMGTGVGPEESAILGIAGEIGLLALALFAVAYTSLVLLGARLLRSPTEHAAAVAGAVLGIGGVALLPVMLTSAIWGDLSVTYVFWSAAGLAAAAVESRGMSTMVRLVRRRDWAVDGEPASPIRTV
jgi:hypothetical protein